MLRHALPSTLVLALAAVLASPPVGAEPSPAVLPPASAVQPVAARRGPTVLVIAPPSRIYVPGGRFVMGATADDIQRAETACEREERAAGALAAEASPRCAGRFAAEAPAVRVYLPGFWLDRTEVTRAQYAACVRAGACAAVWKAPGPPGTEDRPIDEVTFFEAAAACRFRGGRLPTEAEWERAARAGSPGPWPWGPLWRERGANVGRATPAAPATEPVARGPADADGYAELAPVGAQPAGDNAFGFADCAGNVWEWTSGLWSREPPQALATFAPQGPAIGTARVVRGGSYLAPPSDARVSRRVPLLPYHRRVGVGFRCAYDAPPP